MNKKINLVIAISITLGASVLVITANSNSSNNSGAVNATGYNVLYNGDFSKGTTNWTGISSISEDENGKYATLRNGESVNTSYINILPKAEYNFSFKYKIISFTSGNGLTPILSYYSSSNEGVYSDYIFNENSGHFMRDTTISSDWISVSFNFQALDYDMASYYGFNTGGATVQVRDCALTFVNQSPNIIGLGKYNDLDNCAVYGGGTFEYGNGVIGGKGYTENFGLGIESGNHSSDPSWGFVDGCNSLTAIKAYNANALEWKIGRLDLINNGTLYGICLKANVVYEVSFDYKVQKYDTSDTRDLSFRASFGCGKNAFGEHDYENICSYRIEKNDVPTYEWRHMSRDYTQGVDNYIDNIIFRTTADANFEIDNIVIREKITSYEEQFASYFFEKITYDCTDEQDDIEDKWALVRALFESFPEATKINIQHIVANKEAYEGSIERALYRYDRAVRDCNLSNFIARERIS